MNKLFVACIIISLFSCKTTNEEKLKVVGLQETVEVIRDEWGINHIYAKNQHDLFLHKVMLPLRIGFFSLKYGVAKQPELLLKF